MLERYHLDRRLVILTVTLAILSLGLLDTNMVSESISDSYNTLIAQQENWSQTQRSAVINLIYYSRTGDELHYREFHQAIDDILHQHQELMMPLEQGDEDSLRTPFNARSASGGDIENMIWVSKLFYRFLPERLFGINLPAVKPLREAITSQKEAFDLLHKLHSEAIDLHTSMQSGRRLENGLSHVNRILSLDERTSQKMQQASLFFNQGSNELHAFETFNLLLSSILIMGIILFVGFRFARSIKSWHEALTGRIGDLSAREKDYQNLLNSIDDGIYIRNEDGVFININTAGAAMFGYTGEELIGQTANKLDAPESASRTVPVHHQRALQGDTQIHNTWGQHKNGKVVPLEIKITRGTYHGQPVTISVARDISDREAQLKELEKAYNENMMLIGEVHHRVKNNMALISSLLQLQEFETEDEHLQSILQASQNRIQAIARIHELLYHSKSFSQIAFHDFLDQHIEHLRHSIRNRERIEFSLRTEPVMLNINQAIPCALLINELVVAWSRQELHPNGIGSIILDLKRNGDRIHLALAGHIPASYRETEQTFPGTSISSELLSTLAEQLEAEVNHHKDGISHWTISFRMQEVHGSSSGI